MDFQEELERIANEYRLKGYAVVVRPGADNLPGFAKDLGVDILAIRGDEKVLVQVKTDRAEVQADQNVQRLADVIVANPPWRNDLVVLEKDDPLNKAIREAGEPDPERIIEMLESVEKLLNICDSASHLENLQQGLEKSAFVITWAALEAAMRHVCSEFELYMLKYTPGELMRTLYSNGIFSREQFEFLREAMRIRNEIVHGLNSKPVDRETTKKLGDITRWLLHGNQDPTAAVG